MDIKPPRTDRPYISQQFFNWILTICVAFLLGKSCWSPEKTNQQASNCCCKQAAPPTITTTPVIQQDSVYRTNLQPRPSSPTHQLIRGPRGGCYYINESGNKVYVDRSLCD